MLKTVVAGLMFAIYPTTPAPAPEVRRIHLECNATDCTVKKGDLEWLINEYRSMQPEVLRCRNVKEV